MSALRNLVGHEIKPDYGYLERIYPHERELQLKRDAAPELYAALDALISSLGPDGYFTAAGSVKTAAARRALAKARGEQVSGIVRKAGVK